MPSQPRGGGSLVADALHELNRIAHALLIESELFTELRAQLPPEAIRASELLTRDAERMRRMLERISALVRLEQGRGEEPFEEIDLVASIKRTVAASPYVGGVTIEAPSTLRVATDEQAVAQIVTILVENACLHGGGSCRLALISDERGHHIEVSDQGPGLPATLAEVVFEPFAAARLGLASRGSGLGLALARRLAESIGADLSHDAEHFPGAAFRLTLPR